MEEPNTGVKTWAEIKVMVEDAGIRDDDRIFLFDIGPNCEHIFFTRDKAGVEISDTPTLLEGNNE